MKDQACASLNSTIPYSAWYIVGVSGIEIMLDSVLGKNVICLPLVPVWAHRGWRSLLWACGKENSLRSGRPWLKISDHWVITVVSYFCCMSKKEKLLCGRHSSCLLFFSMAPSWLGLTDQYSNVSSFHAMHFGCCRRSRFGHGLFPLLLLPVPNPLRSHKGIACKNGKQNVEREGWHK